MIDSIHESLGTMILQSWGFPQELALVPIQYTDFARAARKADSADVMTVANLQTLVGSTHPFTELYWQQIRAFQNLGLNPAHEASELTEFDADVVAARDAFA